jgi:hypothetical protein
MLAVETYKFRICNPRPLPIHYGSLSNLHEFQSMHLMRLEQFPKIGLNSSTRKSFRHFSEIIPNFDRNHTREKCPAILKKISQIVEK